MFSIINYNLAYTVIIFKLSENCELEITVGDVNTSLHTNHKTV